MFLGMIGALTLIIGGVGVANIMFAAVTHRTREIGVQMALGARRVYITGSLVLESLAADVRRRRRRHRRRGGHRAGAGRGAGEGARARRWSSSARRRSRSRSRSTTVTLLGLIGLLAGYFPARRAVSVQPAEALRFE